jgi:alkylation response protein AidB-like acyl-CoA dehydrogenase
VQDGDDWVIDGSKQFITNAGTDMTSIVTVTAWTGEQEMTSIIVPIDTPGSGIAPPYRKVGWHASDTRELTFDGVRVPVANTLGERGAGFRQFLKTLDDGRIAIAALAVGMIQGCVDECVRYAGEREAFGARSASSRRSRSRSPTSRWPRRPPGRCTATPAGARWRGCLQARGVDREALRLGAGRDGRS